MKKLFISCCILLYSFITYAQDVDFSIPMDMEVKARWYEMLLLEKADDLTVYERPTFYIYADSESLIIKNGDGQIYQKYDIISTRKFYDKKNHEPVYALEFIGENKLSYTIVIQSRLADNVIMVNIPIVSPYGTVAGYVVYAGKKS